MIDSTKAENMMRRAGRLARTVAVTLMAFFPAALGFSQEGPPSLRVVNLDGLPKDVSRDLTDIGFIAGLDPQENPRLFADCCALSITEGSDVRCYEPDMAIGTDVASLTVTVEKGASLNFTTARPVDGGVRCDAAVVDRDGSVTCLDRPVIIDYAHRTVSFTDMPTLSSGDVLMLFVKGASPFEGGQENTGRNYDCG
ncbi:MAG: hypothetical protein JW885_11040 [Deltaproteobacteria bacterium]|nr:hypothetical protein [Candidatus Zymogenaceae bacterium]